MVQKSDDQKTTYTRTYVPILIQRPRGVENFEKKSGNIQSTIHLWQWREHKNPLTIQLEDLDHHVLLLLYSSVPMTT